MSLAYEPADAEEVTRALAAEDYIADRPLATALFLALRLHRPLFLEGEAGVGKTEAAKALARALGARLIRLQCHEGIDLAQAAYEWDYPRQLLHIRLMEGERERAEGERELYSPRFLMRRPLLEAIDNQDPVPPVLLVDEIDRSDEEFEAFLLEVLADFQISIPELGTIRAQRPPVVILTSNRTREVHDALKRRCLYAWIDYPSLEREVEIIRLRAPEVAERLAVQVAILVRGLREMELYKLPGVSETLDWARGLAQLSAATLDPALLEATLGAAVKSQEDLERVRESLPQLLARANGGEGD